LKGRREKELEKKKGLGIRKQGNKMTREEERERKKGGKGLRKE
jgi:hypothetical protein